MSLISAKQSLQLLAVAATLAAGAAQAQSWTSVGSAGVVDEADTGIVDFVNGEARMKTTAGAGSVLNLRYNVVSLPGFVGPGQYKLRTRFRDNGAGANVKLDLRRYQMNGINTVMASLDSDAFGSSANYQVQDACMVVDWDFANAAYYIEATLTKSSAAGTPALGLLQLDPSNCVG